MDTELRKTELARFLRTKREAIRPEDLGIPNGRRRRTPGLRREEVALRANVGLTWYTWLEQGRDIQVSREVVDRLSAAMDLSVSDASYLRSLAGQKDTLPEQTRNEAIDEVQEILNGFTAGPAMLWNSRLDCIASNRLADVIYGLSNDDGPFPQSMIWRTFMDPERLPMYSKSEHLVQNAVGMLRSHYALHLGEPAFESLVKALLENSDLFRTLWTQQRTASASPVVFVLMHPECGELMLRSTRAIFPPIPESTLVFVCPADEATKHVFNRLLVQPTTERPLKKTRRRKASSKSR